MAKSYKDAGLVYNYNANSWDDAVVFTGLDGSFAQGAAFEFDWKEKPNGPRKAYINRLPNLEIIDHDLAGCHIWPWRSLIDKGVCRATSQGEAHDMLSGTEIGDRLRAIIISMDTFQI